MDADESGELPSRGRLTGALAHDGEYIAQPAGRSIDLGTRSARENRKFECEALERQVGEAVWVGELEPDPVRDPCRRPAFECRDRREVVLRLEDDHLCASDPESVFVTFLSGHRDQRRASRLVRGSGVRLLDATADDDCDERSRMCVPRQTAPSGERDVACEVAPGRAAPHLRGARRHVDDCHTALDAERVASLMHIGDR
jgi:hypothetical protein